MHAMPVVAFLTALLIAGVGLTGAAILRNRVPVSAPPGKRIRITTYLTTNVAETREDHPFPELRTRSFDRDPDALIAQVEAAMDMLGWTITRHADSMTLHAEVRTPWLGFGDDLSAEVIGSGKGQSKLHVRSASRVGRADLGANAGHILRLYEAVERLSGVARESG
jgi:uncharacterized protein (DUF1499 family)